MEKSQKFIYKFQIALIFILPLWLGMGRALFGVGGWLYILTVLFLAPVTCILLIVLVLITRLRKDVRETSMISKFEVIWWYVLIAASTLFEIGLVDGGDIQNDQSSVLSKIFGRGFEEPSTILSFSAFAVGVLALIALYSYAIAKLITNKQQDKMLSQPPPIAQSAVAIDSDLQK